MGTVIHDIYVYGAGDGRQLALSLLRYVHAKLRLFTEMGVRIRVHKISERVLQTPRVVEAMESRGITSLPALVTPTDVFLGNLEITAFYERNIRKFDAWGRKAPAVRGRADPEEADELTNYYNTEMRLARLDVPAGTEDDKVGDEGTTHMMKHYDSMLQMRQKRGQTLLEEPGPVRHRPNNVANETTTEFYPASSSRTPEFGDTDGDEGSAQEDRLMYQKYWNDQEGTPGI